MNSADGGVGCAYHGGFGGDRGEGIGCFGGGFLGRFQALRRKLRAGLVFWLSWNE